MSTARIPEPAGTPASRSELKRGDHIRAGYPGAAHHDGIYLGNGQVVHLCGVPGAGKASAHVRIDTLELFAAGRPVTIRPYAGNHDPEAVTARAMSRLGDGNYHLIFNNCQHFARWCATSDHHSEQVTSVTAISGATADPVAAATVGLSLVGSASIVRGLSGPGIMSGLAAHGSIVGGGVVAGLVTLSALPALASVAMINHALREDDDLPTAERTARTAGRLGHRSTRGLSWRRSHGQRPRRPRTRCGRNHVRAGRRRRGSRRRNGRRHNVRARRPGSRRSRRRILDLPVCPLAHGQRPTCCGKPARSLITADAARRPTVPFAIDLASSGPASVAQSHYRPAATEIKEA